MSLLPPTANLLLAELPWITYRRLLPDLEAMNLAAGQELVRPDEPLRFAYFPADCVVTSCYAIEGGVARAWPVGRDGMVGISILSPTYRDARAEVHCGGLAYRIEASVLRAEFQRVGPFRHLIMCHVLACDQVSPWRPDPHQAAAARRVRVHEPDSPLGVCSCDGRKVARVRASVRRGLPA